MVHVGNAPYLLVEFCAVVVTLLAGPSNGIANPGRVPGSNAGNFSQPFVGFPWEFLGVPSTGYSCVLFFFFKKGQNDNRDGEEAKWEIHSPDTQRHW